MFIHAYRSASKEGNVIAGQMKEVRKGSKFFGAIKKERKEKTRGDVKKKNRINFKFPTTNSGFSPDGF